MTKLKTYKFSDLYSMSSGISSKPMQAGHGSPFLSFSTVFNNYFLPEYLTDLMDTTDAEQDTYSILKGDIFLTRTSEVIDELGMSSVALKNYPNATYSGFLKRLRPTQTDITYDKYMAFYLRSKLFRKTMTNNAVLTLRASLNENIFSYLDLVLPVFEDQVKIGDLLHLINSKIELNNRINTELESLAKTIYDYWFVQFDFPDDRGKPYKSSGGKMAYNKEIKREIPMGWKVTFIESILESEKKSIKIPSSEVLTSGKYPVIDQSTDFICGFTNKANSVIEFDRPRIIFGDHTRVLKLINFDFARGADGTQVLLSNNKNLPQHLFYHSLLKIDLSNYGYARHFKFLKQSKILLPNIEVSNKFERNISKSYAMIKQNIWQNQQLTQLRDWLLPMLMNGQVSVK
jgi:type I restriction enzyme, S subunit